MSVILPGDKELDPEPSLTKKSLRINLNENIYGTFAEIGAGQEVARQLGVRFVFLEKVDGALSLRRGFKFKQKENVLVVEDVITQGGRADETINIIRQNGGQVMAVAVLVNRSNGLYDPGIPVYSLLELQVETYDPGDLPEDLKEITAVKPGSN